MSEPDFSGIDPLRVPEARRRIAVLDEYLALNAPSEHDIRRLGDAIGISRSAFSDWRGSGGTTATPVCW